MKDKIVDIEGKKFLMNFSDNSFLEIVDYNEPKINTLTPFSYMIQRKQRVILVISIMLKRKRNGVV